MSKNNTQIGLTMGGCLKQLNSVKYSFARKAKNSQTKEECDDFLSRKKRKTIYVAAIASKRQQLNTLNKSQELALNRDLDTLTNFLKKKLLGFQNLTPSEIAKLCLTYLILFINGRPMEVSELTTVNFIEELEKTQEDHQKIFASLDATEKINAITK